MKTSITNLLILAFFCTCFTIQAQNFHIAEEFSSPEWEAELLRLNPGNQQNDYAFGDNPYTTPAIGGGNAYNDLNNFQLYFGKYRLFGSIECLDVQPCPLGESHTHKHPTANVAIALRIANPAGYLELPEVPNAGKITIHARNGNKGSNTLLGLERYDKNIGTWIPIHAFLLKAWGSYEGTRDEVVSFDVNTDSPIKLRLINNVDATTRFINVYRIEIEEKL